MLILFCRRSLYVINYSSDKDIISTLSMTNEIPELDSNTVQPLNMQKKVLEKYPNINEDIRKSIIQHRDKQSKETV